MNAVKQTRCKSFWLIWVFLRLKKISTLFKGWRCQGKRNKKKKSCIRIKDKQTPHTASPLNVVLENCVNVVIGFILQYCLGKLCQFLRPCSRMLRSTRTSLRMTQLLRNYWNGSGGYAERRRSFQVYCDLTYIDPWSPGGSFMVQKMAITSPIPIF